MKKRWMVLASCVLATSLMAGSVYAKSEGDSNKGKSDTVKVNLDLKVKSGSEQTVTSDTYGNQGHNGYKGLLNAINNVKDKPAGVVIADLLLTKYETHLTAEMKAQLEAIKDKDAALSAAADLLDKNGSVTDAVYVQKEAIIANVSNLDSYKKLGKLYDKLGKKGIKLYVNGAEPTFEVAPFIREGNTLVPFRAISEALKATVTWNEEERSVTVTRDGITVKLFIDSKTATVNGKEVTLEVPASIEKGSTVVPVRFVSEALKAAVKWESETQSVVIYEQ
ncbi:copper amine oxidase N-terminal domain-containing protein [Paenibacillus sp. SYP-B3998]|uniref:Copper amine oxidase N-terminal domain-containing protein n=1 Tax=Paenibacillus sp. SYP-B3998 TaxID=2678564 RepID=A0A6G3ZUQ5_9BACL|nr:copper amine oxidase N-terminal domain-containing protein [Paenibacillus sp. SYP-B3998]NEW05872.1 copper amine oxidase N-terminal domain-containing protein [Paenibacillus sp. SYP-B3998]